MAAAVTAMRRGVLASIVLLATALDSSRLSGQRDRAAPFQDAALTFGDLEKIRGWYNEYDAVLSRVLASGTWGALANDPAAQANVMGTKNELRELLSAVSNRSADRNVVLPILIRLRALFTTVSTEIYARGSPPAALNLLENNISGLLSSRLASQLDEYYRAFFIKYGESSERLNWIEMFLTEALFTPSPIGPTVRLPAHWEVILREQVIGYQYDGTVKSFRPSSPVSQVGLTYYFFAHNRLKSLVNHLGVAGAYQHELGAGVDLYGVVLHLNRLDFGFFCQRKCVTPVWATSINVQLIRRIL